MQPIFHAAADLEHLWALDEARWIATSAPVTGLRCDPVFLTHLDDDLDGRLRPRELKSGVRWLLSRLVDTGGVDACSDRLRLDALRDDEEGERLRASADRVLAFLDATDRSRVSLAQVRQFQARMAQALTAGDGVVTVGVSGDPDVERLVADIGGCLGWVHDAQGRDGIRAGHLDRFEAATAAYLDWVEHPVAVAGLSEPLAAWRALDDVVDKLHEFFALSELAGLDPRIATVPGLADDALEGRAWAHRDEAERLLLAAPLARPEPSGRLDGTGWLNPAWRTRWDALVTHTLVPLGRDASLDRSELRELKGRFRDYGAWQARKAGAEVASVGLETLEHWDAHPEIAQRLRALFAEEQDVAEELESLVALEQLILSQRWMLELVNSFVGFSRFYNPALRSLIEVGTLIMDGRRFNLCVRIESVEAHRALAKAGLIYLAYVEVQTTPEPMLVAVAVTGRERGRLFVGKRGVFYDADQVSYEALVVELLDNPISVSEALLRPFRRLGTYLAERSEAFTAGRYDALEETVGGTLDGPGEAPGAAQTAAPTNTRELFLSGGIALAAVSSALAYVAETLSHIEVGSLVLSLLGLILLAIVPAALIAAWRIHRRDLSIVLEASGWAINQQLRIPTWAGSVYTQRPPFPDDARLEGTELLRQYRRDVVEDEVEVRRQRLMLVLLLVVILGAAVGVFEQWLTHSQAGAAWLQSVLGRMF